MAGWRGWGCGMVRVVAVAESAWVYRGEGKGKVELERFLPPTSLAPSLNSQPHAA